MPLTFDPDVSVVTEGLLPPLSGSKGESLITSGLVPLLRVTARKPGVMESSPESVALDIAQNKDKIEQALGANAFTLFDLQGDSIMIPADLGVNIPLGDGKKLSFDPFSLIGKVFPALGQVAGGVLGILDNTSFTYTGSDMRILLEVAEGHLYDTAHIRLSKQLVECTTLTVSVHREKAPIRACGYINPKGFARGRRTIAGTIILTQFTVDSLFRFLQAVLQKDISKDTQYLKVDQLPPLNLTLIFNDEHGHASIRRLLGVEFITDGTVYSIQDMLTEQTISYTAADFTPLVPMNFSSIFSPPLLRDIRAGRWEKVVEDVLKGALGASSRRAFTP